MLKEVASKSFSLVTGGQSGVDRAALDAALSLGIPYSGWCPKGGWAEDFKRPPGVLLKYPNLKPTPEAGTEQRTLWNVRDSEASIVLSIAASISPGTEVGAREALRLGKPCLQLYLDNPDSLSSAAELISSLEPDTRLSVGGPRESESPGIYSASLSFLLAVLG